MDLIKFWDSNNFDLIRLLIVQSRDDSSDTLNESLYPHVKELKKTLQEVAELIAEKNLSIGVRCGFYGTKEFQPPPGIKIIQSTIYSKNNKNIKIVPAVRQDTQLGNWPKMHFPCKSPFVYARIKWDGTVDLCNNRNFEIGNIYNDNLKNIWNSFLCEETRYSIKKDRSICNNCDYYKFCLNIRSLDINSKKSHFPAGLLNNEKIINFIKNNNIKV